VGDLLKTLAKMLIITATDSSRVRLKFSNQPGMGPWGASCGFMSLIAVERPYRVMS
jgi:hypothetical protein